MLLAANLPAQAARVILVRHAEKVDDSRDPELSAAGKARAMALVTALDTVQVDAVLVSQFRRTAMTAAPVAARHRLEPEIVRVRGNAAEYGAAVAARIRELPRGSTVLVVGHSNTLAPTIAALGGPAIADLCDGEYARLFVLDLRGRTPALSASSYGALPEGSAATCPRQMTLPPADTSSSGALARMPDTPKLPDLAGAWTGHNKLWFMPNAPVHESATTATIRTVAGGRYLVMDYTWSHDGTPHDGHMVVRLTGEPDDADIVWVDSFHQSASIMRLSGVAKSASAVTARGSYPAPTGPDWGWKIAVAAEAQERLVMRMWNITPDGQEALAVEAVYARQ